jgi:hypothetical protein
MFSIKGYHEFKASTAAFVSVATAAITKTKKKAKQPERSGNLESRPAAAALQEEDFNSAEEEDPPLVGESICEIMKKRALSVAMYKARRYIRARICNTRISTNLECIIEQALRVACVEEFSDKDLHVGGRRWHL